MPGLFVHDFRQDSQSSKATHLTNENLRRARIAPWSYTMPGPA